MHGGSLYLLRTLCHVPPHLLCTHLIYILLSLLDTRVGFMIQVNHLRMDVTDAHTDLGPISCVMRLKKEGILRLWLTQFLDNKFTFICT